MTLSPIPARIPQDRAEPQAKVQAGNAADGAAGFSDLLAGLLRLSGEMGQSEGGPADLTGSVPSDVARIFNEYGFFASPESPAPAAGRIGTQPVSEDVPEGVVEQATPEVQDGRNSGDPRALVQEPDLAVGSRSVESSNRKAGIRADIHAKPGTAHRNGGRVSSAVATALATQGEQPLAQLPETAEGIAQPERSGANRAPISATGEGSAFDARIAVQAAGGEASLVMRLNALSREERARLRTEIVQLLARHGFSAGAMTLNGESEPVERL